MKKIIIAFILIIVIVGVSYLKAVRDKSPVPAVSGGLAEAGISEELYNHQIDSLSDLIEQYQVAIADTLKSVDGLRKEQTDSLQKIIDIQDREIAALYKKREAVQQQLAVLKSSTTISKPKVKTAEKKIDHRQILTFYKKKYKELPKDLSPYEKRVAVNEIRVESAKKFAITVAELNKIRERNKLPY